MNAAPGWRVVIVAILAQWVTTLTYGETLRSIIDRQLNPVAGLTARPASDAEFLRRVSLDLIGMIPAADEARAFLTDSSADKRERLIDRLLGSPHYARHIALVLDVMLMERRGATHVSVDEWQAWLLKSVRENKPWNVLAREILAADGDDAAQRAPARFVLDRASESHLLTRDVGRIFFGRDMQCAQCHDHPLVPEYLQSDYHGLLAYIAPGFAMVRKEGEAQKTIQAEKAGAELTFESVFIHEPRRTGARLPDNIAIEEPFFLPGDEYDIAPAENVKPVPKFSRRKKMAELATNGSNGAFNRNIVNRLWALMFGRGLVHPPDLHHPDNPPSHPELLRLLAEQFAAMNFDIRSLLREIALSQAYQRSSNPPDDLLASSTDAAAEVEKLQQQVNELTRAAEASAESYATAFEAWEQAEAAKLPMAGELDTARNQYAEAKAKFEEAQKGVADAVSQLEAKKNVAAPVQQAAAAAEAAAKVLPEDKELAEAAQKFVSKSQQLIAEMATLTKTFEEKTAAVAPVEEAWNNAKPPVDAALSKLAPTASAVREAEQAMLAARTRAAADAELVAALSRRLETMQVLARLPKLRRALSAASQAVTDREAEFASAQKPAEEFAPIAAQHEADAKAATDAVSAAASALETARTDHATRSEQAKLVDAAFTAASAASEKLADDAALAAAVSSLQESLARARNKVEEAQQQIETATAAQRVAEETFVTAQEALAAALAERARRQQALETASTALDAAKAEFAARQSECDSATAKISDHSTTDFTVASLKPLTPEQLCWSIFRATGVYDRYWKAEVAELDKEKPLSDEQKQDPAQAAAREHELEQRTYDKLKGNVGTFVSLYGAAPGQPQGDFYATADQALFAANAGALNGWVAPAGDNVTERVIKQEDPQIAAEELYLSVLTRFPTEEEKADVVQHLRDRAGDKASAAQELVWALLNSAEFRFNH